MRISLHTNSCHFIPSCVAVAILITTSMLPSSTAFSFTSIGTQTNRAAPSVPSFLRQGQTKLFSEGGIAGGAPNMSKEEEEDLQWNLFLKNQARGQWRGTWTTYDYMGDIIDETNAAVNLMHDENTGTVHHTHDIIVGSKSSDCETCFDSDDVKTFPVAQYSKGNMAKYRCASVGMLCGPSLTRSGAMSTELILSHKDSRLRVVYQHAPVWEKGIEPGSCPPQGLKLFRVMVSKERLYSLDQSEQNSPFEKGVPPFMWHKKWAGTAWTWGSQTGDRGWSVEELEEGDAWHGRPTGDTSDTWALRLGGGILLQCPRVISSGFAGLCKLAWLPELSEEQGGKGVDSRLLRMEASILALEPIIDEEQDAMLGFYPPELASLRCDTFEKIGELENTSMLEKLRNSGELDNAGGAASPEPEPSTQAPPKSSAKPAEKSNDTKTDKPNDDSGLDAIRNALKL